MKTKEKLLEEIRDVNLDILTSTKFQDRKEIKDVLKSKIEEYNIAIKANKK